MKRPWWLRLVERGRGVWWPVHYRIDGASWWSLRGKQYRYRPAPTEDPAPSQEEK